MGKRATQAATVIGTEAIKFQGDLEYNGLSNIVLVWFTSFI